MPRIEQAIALLKAGHESELLPHLAALGQQLLPFLKLLDRDLKMHLPIADIEKRLLDSGLSSENLPGDEAQA